MTSRQECGSADQHIDHRRRGALYPDLRPAGWQPDRHDADRRPNRHWCGLSRRRRNPAKQASIHGLTTAATIWVDAAVGMAAAAGEFGLAVGGAVIAMATLIGLEPIERFIGRDARNRSSGSRRLAQPSMIDSPTTYSSLNTIVGLMCDARQAGSHPAADPTPTRTAAAAANVSGSHVEMEEQRRADELCPPPADERPRHDAHSEQPTDATEHQTNHADRIAPSATRTPISFRRRLTENAVTP